MWQKSLRISKHSDIYSHSKNKEKMCGQNGYGAARTDPENKRKEHML